MLHYYWKLHNLKVLKEDIEILSFFIQFLSGSFVNEIVPCDCHHSYLKIINKYDVEKACETIGR
jgi:hypothetical protein